MAANELAEAIQALAWVAMTGTLGVLEEGGIYLRSQCGFQQRIITSESPKDYGLIILLLERTHTRQESCVLVSPITTTDGGETYPVLVDSDTWQLEQPARAPLVQPIMLEWLGPDLASPDWLPFTNDAPALDGVNQNEFNAIAIAQPASNLGVSMTQDFCVAVYKMPPLPEGTTTTVQAVLPVPTPP